VPSGRYRPVDPGDVDESLSGVMIKLSAVEYAVRIRGNNARDGKASMTCASGADYSWNRGTIRLITDTPLESRTQQ
jgi:hypothetical protein